MLAGLKQLTFLLSNARRDENSGVGVSGALDTRLTGTFNCSETHERMLGYVTRHMQQQSRTCMASK